MAGVKLATYTELVKAVRVAMAGGRKRAEEAVERERVFTAWEIGKLIDEHVLQHKERADYAQYVLPKLAKDLATSRTELYYMLEFARTYPIVPHAGQLSWSDYRDLLVVNVPEKRKALTEQAEKENWSRDRLRKEVRNATRNVSAGGQAGEPSDEKLSPAQPGKLGTYKIILAKAGPYAGKLALDLGFSNYYLPPGKFSFKEGDIISSPTSETRSQKGVAEDLYTYEAFIYKVLDGDTVAAVVDLGFGFVATQTLRLRGIDAPELPSTDGVEAKTALENMLKMPRNLPGAWKKTSGGERGASGKNGFLIKTFVNDQGAIPVLIKTVRSDKYDRYLADIFVGDVYVNQQLVENGFAVIVQE